jgi:hypothetical protein
VKRHISEVIISDDEWDRAAQKEIADVLIYYLKTCYISGRKGRVPKCPSRRLRE